MASTEVLNWRANEYWVSYHCTVYSKLPVAAGAVAVAEEGKAVAGSGLGVIPATLTTVGPLVVTMLVGGGAGVPASVGTGLEKLVGVTAAAASVGVGPSRLERVQPVVVRDTQATSRTPAQQATAAFLLMCVLLPRSNACWDLSTA